MSLWVFGCIVHLYNGVELDYIDNTWRDAALSSAIPTRGAVHILR